jgi:hypothetical protein
MRLQVEAPVLERTREPMEAEPFRMGRENIGRRPYPLETRMARGVCLAPEQHAARELAVAAARPASW